MTDIDRVASDFTDLNFVVEDDGLPRLQDVCWIATQEPNVDGGLAVAMPFIHTHPKYFAQVMGRADLLDRRGPHLARRRLRDLVSTNYQDLSGDLPGGAVDVYINSGLSPNGPRVTTKRLPCRRFIADHDLRPSY